MSTIERQERIDVHSTPPTGAKVEVVHYRSPWPDSLEEIDPQGRPLEDIVEGLTGDAIGVRVRKNGDTEPVMVFARGVIMNTVDDIGKPLAVLAKKPDVPVSSSGNNRLLKPHVVQRIGDRDVVHPLHRSDIVLPPRNFRAVG